MMANHAGDIVVVHLTKALWKEFRDRHWHDFEEFEEIKDQRTLCRHLKSSMIVDSSSSKQKPRVVTIVNSGGNVMSDSMNSEKSIL
ncbi:hypothetical protein DICVIV_12036 [Dictyocaulus viviparus]|uniref:Uncharacterized protein n=1 Tax=Dictyocaulus viviparus TaxID=29172 RepID=A0A0D8XBM9_DICVI|nr:hypothetical protein DICVIV_12036 [Dictyocaulus viviparus]